MIRTIREAARLLRDKRLSCVALLEQCLDRISKVEPTVQAWVFVDAPRARAEAEARDRELDSGYDRGWLHGIPLGIKDIIDVFDWPTACGSTLWRQSFARQDATLVRRLRQAGAVLLGKTVTTQYASFDPPATRNPWKLSRTPGGSSSGSAAAVATRMCLGTIGSQTGGSITRPGAYCGVPSCKPTYGIACLDGVLPLAPSMDHPGPFAACVEDLSILLQAIVDPGHQVAPGAIRPPRLGRLGGLFERLADDEVNQMMEQTCTRLRQQGATIQELALPASFEEVTRHHAVVMAVEAAAFHRERLIRHPDDYKPKIRSLIEEGMRTPGPDYLKAREYQSQLTRDMANLFAEVDALIAPATTTPAPDAATTGNPAFNSPWSFTGLPVVALPVALSRDGLPLGIQLIGPAREESRLFSVGLWMEQFFMEILGEPSLTP